MDVGVVDSGLISELVSHYAMNVITVIDTKDRVSKLFNLQVLKRAVDCP